MSGLGESRFNMWRAVVAMMHADLVIRPHEINFILENTKDVPLSDEQRQRLMLDLKEPVSIDEVFHKIFHAADKEDFFHLARAIAWSDGDFSEKERAILQRLAAITMDRGDKDALDHSLKSFEEIYYDKAGKRWQSRDKNVTGMVKQLLASRA